MLSVHLVPYYLPIYLIYFQVLHLLEFGLCISSTYAMLYQLST